MLFNFPNYHFNKALDAENFQKPQILLIYPRITRIVSFNVMYITRHQRQIQEELHTRQRKIFDALLAGTATIQRWGELPEEMKTALEGGYEMELDFTGDFIIHPRPCSPAQDVEMIDAPLQPTLQYPSIHICTAPHSRTGGVCPTQWPLRLGNLETLRHHLRLTRQQPQNANRFRAFFAIKERTKSEFGNSSSPLAHELLRNGGFKGQRVNRRYERRTVLDSWKVAPVWERLQKGNVGGLSCEKDRVTGNPVLFYSEDHP
jgi:hypothetical protein